MTRRISQIVLVLLGCALSVACQPQQTASSTPADSTQALQLENDKLKQENDSLEKLLESERMTPRAEMPPSAPPLAADTAAKL
jgi:hypothetical protein